MTDLLPTAVYLLCFLNSAACAWMLGRSYVRTKTRLLLWSSLCFVLLAANNLALVIDLLVLPDIDLMIARLLLSLAGVSVLIFGFIWDLEAE